MSKPVTLWLEYGYRPFQDTWSSRKPHHDGPEEACEYRALPASEFDALVARAEQAEWERDEYAADVAMWQNQMSVLRAERDTARAAGFRAGCEAAAARLIGMRPVPMVGESEWADHKRAVLNNAIGEILTLAERGEGVGDGAVRAAKDRARGPGVLQSAEPEQRSSVSTPPPASGSIGDCGGYSAAQPVTPASEREAFEAWYARYWKRGHTLQRSGGIYCNDHVASCWESWEARAALSAPPADVAAAVMAEREACAAEADEYSDVLDGNDGRPRPNTAMKIAQAIRSRPAPKGGDDA